LGKSGLAAALFLRQQRAQVTVSICAPAAALAKEIPALLEHGIMVESRTWLLTFRRQDLIVVSPGVPLDTPELVQVKTFGLPVIGEWSWLPSISRARFLPSPVPTARPRPRADWRDSGCRRHSHPGGGNIGVPVVRTDR